MILFCLDVSAVEQNPSINKLVNRLPGRYSRGMNKYRSPQDQRKLLLSDLLLKWVTRQDFNAHLDLQLSDLPQDGFDLCQLNNWIVCATSDQESFGIDLHRLGRPSILQSARSEYAQHLKALRRATLRALRINHIGHQRLEINNDILRLGKDTLYYQQIGIDQQHCCCIVSKKREAEISVVGVSAKTLIADAMMVAY